MLAMLPTVVLHHSELAFNLPYLTSIRSDVAV